MPIKLIKKPSVLDEQNEATYKEAVMILGTKDLISESYNAPEFFKTINEQSIDVAKAVCMLDKFDMLTKESNDAIFNALTGQEAVAIAHNIINGLENLKKLEKYGMNTEKNRKAVSSAGEKAVQTSLKLWEQKKKAVIADVRERTTGHPLAMAYASVYARSSMDETMKELETVTQSLHKPEAVKALSPKKKG